MRNTGLLLLAHYWWKVFMILSRFWYTLHYSSTLWYHLERRSFSSLYSMTHQLGWWGKKYYYYLLLTIRSSSATTTTIQINKKINNNNYCNYHLLLTEGVTPTSSRQIRASTEKTVIEYLVTKKKVSETHRQNEKCQQRRQKSTTRS